MSIMQKIKECAKIMFASESKISDENEIICMKKLNENPVQAVKKETTIEDKAEQVIRVRAGAMKYKAANFIKEELEKKPKDGKRVIYKALCKGFTIDTIHDGKNHLGVIVSERKIKGRIFKYWSLPTGRESATETKNTAPLSSAKHNEIIFMIDGVRFLRMPIVTKKTGLSIRAIEGRIYHNTFPKPQRIAKNAVAWREDVINEWINNNGAI